MAQIPYFQLLRLQAAVLAAVHLRVVQADQAAAAALLHNQAVLAQAVRVIMAVILQLQMMAAAAAVQDQ
jgi:hypothetical protein